MTHNPRPPSLDDLGQMAQSILDELPEPFSALIKDIPIRIEDWPDKDILDEMGIDDPLELTGLYRGTPIGERATMTASSEPEMIFLFRMPMLLEWCARQIDLYEIVFDVLTHEIGHHFGMDEEQVLRMEGRDSEGSPG